MAGKSFSKKLFSGKVSGLVMVACRQTVPKMFSESILLFNRLPRSQMSDVAISKAPFQRSGSKAPRRNVGMSKTLGTRTPGSSFARTLTTYGNRTNLTCIFQTPFRKCLGALDVVTGRRYLMEGQGLVLPRKRMWWRYCGALVLILGAGTVSFLHYRKLSFKNRGVSLFYIPHLPLQLVAPFGCYKGIAISTYMLNSIEQVENFEVREDDIFVVSFPRSGTTWTQELVYMVANDADVEKANSMNLEARFPYLENHENTMDTLNTAESPRFIKSHMPYRMLPKDIDTKKPKIIYVMRNPKDMVVSFYHLWQKMRAGYNGQFSDFCELFLQDNLIFSPWTEHVKEFWERREEDNILFLKYEDLHMNLSHEVERISKFLGKSLTPEQVATIVDHCSFDSMKKNDQVNYKWWNDRGLTANITFIRKGRVGDWKNFFTPELNARMSEKVEGPLAKMGIEVKYE